MCLHPCHLRYKNRFSSAVFTHRAAISGFSFAPSRKNLQRTSKPHCERRARSLVHVKTICGMRVTTTDCFIHPSLEGQPSEERLCLLPSLPVGGRSRSGGHTRVLYCHKCSIFKAVAVTHSLSQSVRQAARQLSGVGWRSGVGSQSS